MRTKYRSVACRVDGVRFASKKERDYYWKLKVLKSQKIIKDFELQPKFRFPMGFTYKADFKVIYPTGEIEIIETKGFKTRDYKLKKKCLLYFYPDVRFTEV